MKNLQEFLTIISRKESKKIKGGGTSMAAMGCLNYGWGCMGPWVGVCCRGLECRWVDPETGGFCDYPEI